ncbi:MAG: hypothetical protein AAB577_01250 [Patescibacteria group bacterium]
MSLTKKDLKEIKSVVVEATEPYFTAIKDDFNNMDDRFDKIDESFDEIKTKLSSLERRVIALEDMSTEHGKELRNIRKILTQLKNQRKIETEKVLSLERKIIRLEAKAA